MDPLILVAYASRHGSTAEIAGWIRHCLREYGLRVEAAPVARVSDLGPYSAVILGSAVYTGQWMQSAAAFLQDHEGALTRLPVWLFSSGPTGQDDPSSLLRGWRFPGSLQPMADRIGVRDIALLHGALDPAKLSMPERLIARSHGLPAGDFRDWRAIANWTRLVAKVLKVVTA